MEKKSAEHGSITLEACMVVPMFVMLMLLLNGLFLLFMGQQIMSHTLIQSAKSMAFDPYATQRIEGNEDDSIADLLADLFNLGDSEYSSTEAWYDGEESDVAEIAEERFIAYLSSSSVNANKLLKAIGVENGTGGLDFSGSCIEDDVLFLKVKYVQEYLFNALDLTSFEMALQVKVNLFNYKTIE